MVKEFIELLTELAGLTPGQFLLLWSLGLAASVCLGFPAQTQFRVPGLLMRALTFLIWFGSWLAMPNALVDCYTHWRACLIAGNNGNKFTCAYFVGNATLSINDSVNVLRITKRPFWLKERGALFQKELYASQIILVSYYLHSRPNLLVRFKWPLTLITQWSMKPLSYH